MALFTASAWAEALKPSGTQDITTAGTYDAIIFESEATLNIKAVTTISYNSEFQDTQASGNIKVASGVTAGISGTNGADLFLNVNGTGAAQIYGAGKTSSTLYFDGYQIITKNGSSDSTYKDLIVKDITLNMDRLSIGQWNRLTANAIEFDNAILNVTKGTNPSGLSAMGSSTFGGDFSENAKRSFYFKNSELNIDNNATLSLLVNSNGNKGIVFNNSTLTLQDGAKLRTGTQIVIFDQSTFNYYGGAIETDDGTGQANKWRFSGISTVKIYKDLNLTQKSSDNNDFWGTLTFNLANNTKLYSTKTSNYNDVAGITNIIGGIGTSVDFAYTRIKTDAVLNVSTATGNFTKLDMANGATLNVSAGETTVGDIFATTKINLDVVNGAVLTITDFNQATEGETFKIALDDEIVKGALLVADEKIGTYASEVASREYMFVDEAGNERVVGSNLWIEAVENGFWSVYTSNPAVPEPAEWAAIFGAIALGFAVYRRRK